MAHFAKLYLSVLYYIAKVLSVNSVVVSFMMDNERPIQCEVSTACVHEYIMRCVYVYSVGQLANMLVFASYMCGGLLGSHRNCSPRTTVLI